MLQDIVGVPALSAGLWYVAIDLQLFALMLILMWALRQMALDAYATFAVTLSTAASLLLFNIDPTWDAWGLYFFGAYGLGALAWWSSASNGPSARRWVLVALIAGLTTLSLIAMWRSRIALAGFTACILAWCGGPASAQHARQTPRALAWLSDRSYALFLVHYPVCLLFNAAAQRWLPHSPGTQALALFAAWAVSMLASHFLYIRVERPAGTWPTRIR
jgi:peptidoglycan/LPS O-acetylase OafA/YrhL